MIELSDVHGENFCIAPWTNLHIQTDGAIKPCCGGGGSSARGNFGYAQNEDWSYINQNSQSLTELKQQLLNNQPASYCDGCHEKPWYSEFLKQNLSVDNINDFLFKSVDLRWGTTCQLSCVYCGPWSSSTWQKLNSKQKVIPIQSSRTYNGMFDQLYDFLENNSSNIERVNLLGGEPLLLKENNRLLDIVPETAHVEIFTNLNLDLESNILYQKLVSRPNVRWYISMENIADRFEFVRRGANWQSQETNIKKLLTDTNGRTGQTVSLQSQFCVYSALNLKELYDYFTPMGILINWAVLVSPEVLNFMHYPKHLKEQSIRDIDTCIQHYSDDVKGSLRNIRQELINTIDDQHQNIISDCHAWHNQLEQKYFSGYQHTFTQLWPNFL